MTLWHFFTSALRHQLSLSILLLKETQCAVLSVMCILEVWTHVCHVATVLYSLWAELTIYKLSFFCCCSRIFPMRAENPKCLHTALVAPSRCKNSTSLSAISQTKHVATTSASSVQKNAILHDLWCWKYYKFNTGILLQLCLKW